MVSIIALAFVLNSGAVDAKDLSLTIYNDNLSLVQDVRRLELGQGRQRIEFKDVSASIRPETVTLSAADVTIVEQNFDYDLLSPDKMMEKSVGREVQIVRTNPGNGQQTTETATVLAVNGGVVLRIGDRIEVLRDDGVPTRVIFDKVPENLRARPTLSVTVDSGRAGGREAALSYLTRGLSWKADYVALFDEKAGSIDVQGWVTLSNRSGTPFTNASARLVAGDINDGGYRSGGRSGGAGTESGGEALADYYVYPLPERTTIADQQTKQVSFLDARGAAARKIYAYEASGFASRGGPEQADVVVRFSNASAGGLGAQLPAGTVRVYVRDAQGKAQFIGEDRIEHTPRGSELLVRTGQAFDVSVQPLVVASQPISKTRNRYTVNYIVRNARAQPVTVNVRQGGLWQGGRIISESLKGKRLDASMVAWDVPVPANGETTLKTTIETGE